MGAIPDYKKHTGHEPSQISTLVQQLFLSSSAGKRKRKDTIGEAGNVDGGNELEAAAEAGPADEPGMEVEAAAAQDDELATPPKKIIPTGGGVSVAPTKVRGS
jgi:hypothetical protein